MNQLLQEQIAPPLKKSVKIKQIAAAIFLIIGLFSAGTESSLAPLYQESDFSDIVFYRSLTYITIALLSIIGFIILSTISANRPTKLMIYVLIGFEGFHSLCNILKIAGCLSSVPVDIQNTIYTIFSVATIIGKIYAYSIIIKNSSIAENDIKWINILCISAIANLYTTLHILLISFGVFQSLIIDSFGILTILLIIAYIKFCRCAAFNGNVDNEDSAIESYSPINKYTVSMVITTIIILITMTIYDKLIVQELMMINI